MKYVIIIIQCMITIEFIISLFLASLISSLFVKPILNEINVLTLFLFSLSTPIFIIFLLTIFTLQIIIIKRIYDKMYVRRKIICENNQSIDKKIIIHAKLSGLCHALSKIIFLFTPANHAWYYKLTGAKIGKNSKIYGYVLEPDLITIGNNCIIGEGVIIAAHVHEINKSYYNHVMIGNNCLIGANSLIFPGVVVEDNVRIGACSVVAKNKRIPSGKLFLNPKPKLFD